MMMIRSRKEIPPDRQYYLDTQEGEKNKRVALQRVSQEKDLGVTFDERLTFEQHILEKVKKANQTMGLNKISFSYLDIQSFRWQFKAMVRPHLEYAQSVWSPFRMKDIVTIENVQRRPTNMLPGLKELSYKERLK